MALGCSAMLCIRLIHGIRSCTCCLSHARLGPSGGWIILLKSSSKLWTSFAGAGLGSDSTAGPTLGASGLGQSEGARASAPAKSSGPSALESSFYRSAEPVHMPQVGGAAAAQTTRGTATGADFDSTYRSTEPVRS